MFSFAVFATRRWIRIALLCNLLGAVLLFLSFQAESSDIKVVTTREGDVALCVNDRLLVKSQAYGGVTVGTVSCPEVENGKPAAIVNFDMPLLVDAGFFLIFIVFILQFLGIPPDSKTAP
jgi:uncharacterized membrane protein